MRGHQLPDPLRILEQRREGPGLLAMKLEHSIKQTPLGRKEPEDKPQVRFLGGFSIILMSSMSDSPWPTPVLPPPGA